jgi:type IV secretion system protein VirB8
MTKDPELQAYFADAASWDRDRVAMQARSARIAWWVAGAGWIASLALVAVLVILMPLKKVEPFVIRVDNASGMVDVVPVYVGQTGMPETVSRYFLTHYVTVCERFNFPTAESDYQECGAFHTPQRNQLWYAAWAKTNPKPIHASARLFTVLTRCIDCMDLWVMPWTSSLPRMRSLWD